MDNRRVLRRRKRLPVRFGTDQLKYMGYTEDLSPRGLFIQTAAVLKPGSLLQVQLTSRDGKQVLLEGRIRWAKKVPPQMLRKIKAGMGVMILRFVEGEEHFREFLPGE